MQVPLDRNAPQPLYRQIMQFLDSQITAGNLPPGSKLPPIRELAERLGVSKTIVSMAYAEMQAAGRVEGRVGQGTVVTAHSPAVPLPQPLPLAPGGEPGAAVLHDLLRLGSDPGLINLTTGSPALENLQAEAFARCLKATLEEDGPAALGYDSPEGSAPLRQAVARHLVSRGIVATPAEVLITNGAQQAIDLAVRGLAAPGEWVVMEDPCYMGALEVCRTHGVRIASAAMDDDGLVVEQLEPLLRRLRPRLLYTTPTFQNPTGSTMSLLRRQRLVELAERWGVTILEDGVCSDLELVGSAPPALKALGSGVVHCGSFSKSFLPGIRLGYLTAAPDIIRRLSLIKQSTDIHSSTLLQMAMARYLSSGAIGPHLRRMAKIYRQRRDAALSALKRHFPADARWTEPAGGLHIWITLPPETNVGAAYVAAIGEGVGFAPGSVFFQSGSPGKHLRIAYGAEPPERIEAGIRILGRLLAGQLRPSGRNVPVL